MSECVVRMEMPQSCKKCISTNCIWGKNGSDYLDVIAALQDFRRANNDGFPDFCPILCQLPEGHGRLVDADALYKKRYIVEPGDILASITVVDACYISGAQTIVPAEAERSEDA